jgi:hypothetical protein
MLTRLRISTPIGASDSQTSAVSCHVSTAFAAASAAPSLARVDEIHVLRAASMMSR